MCVFQILRETSFLTQQPPFALSREDLLALLAFYLLTRPLALSITLFRPAHTRSLVQLKQLQPSPARLSFFPGRYRAAMGGVGGGGGDGDDDGGGGREKARLSLICVVPGSILRCLAETP